MFDLAGALAKLHLVYGSEKAVLAAEEITRIMLVSAFAGKENVLAAYEQAVREKYRF